MSRYVYGMRLRPAAPGAMPKDGLVQVDTNDTYSLRRNYWGILRYDRQLTEKECDDYDLDYLWTEREEV